MKTNKALKRLDHAEYLVSDLLERFSADVPDIREKLQDAKTAVTRAKDAMKLQTSAGTTSARKKVVSKKAAVKVARAKAANKQSKTKQDYQG